MKKPSKEHPLCWQADPELWREFCELRGHAPYRSDTWTVTDVQLLVPFLRKQKGREPMKKERVK